MKTNIKKPKSKSSVISSAKDMPITLAMLYGVRDELRESSMYQFHTLDGKISTLDGKISTIQVDIHGVKSEIHRLAILIEEQNKRNSIVMDSLTSLYGRQDRLEKRFDEFEKI